jgi:hypothetical protein
MVLDPLGVCGIKANTPQAKSGVERLWGTLQNRFVKELRLERAQVRETHRQRIRLRRFKQLQ